MKYGLLFLILAVVLGMPQSGYAQTFLSYEQFSKLDHPQQLSYIEAVRKLTLTLARSPHLSGRIESDLRLFQRIDWLGQALPWAWAQDSNWETCRVTSAKHYSTEDLLSKMLLMQNCREVSVNGGPQYFVSVVPESVAVLAQEYSQRIDDGRLNPNSYKVKDASGGLEAVLSELRRVGVRGRGNYETSMRQADTALRRAWAKFGAKPSVATRSRVAPTTHPTSERASSRIVTAGASAKTGRAASPKRAETSSPKSTGASSQDVVKRTSLVDSSAATRSQAGGVAILPNQCLYGGFVIDQTAQKGCQPFSQLPEEFGASFFDRDHFHCGEATPVLCNPLLFGFLPDCDEGEKPPCYKKKPLCTPRSVKATMDCYNQALERHTLRYVEDVWNGPDGQKMYEKFIGSLEELCDSQSLRKRDLKPKSKADIEQTCEVAFRVFDDLVAKKFLPQTLRKGNQAPEVSQPEASGVQK